eukprot:350266-Chlamydomonas_euryale.AAC.9
MIQPWTAQPPPAEWIRRGQPAHTPPQRPPVAEGKGRHKGGKGTNKDRKRTRGMQDERGKQGRTLYVEGVPVAQTSDWPADLTF